MHTGLISSLRLLAQSTIRDRERHPLFGPRDEQTRRYSGPEVGFGDSKPVSGPGDQELKDRITSALSTIWTLKALCAGRRPRVVPWICP